MKLVTMQADKSYNKKLFTQPLNIHLECPICFDIMKDPVLCTAQGHTFCRHCVTSHLGRSKTCPNCREPLQKDKLLPNRLVCSLIEDAEVYCFTYEFTEEERIKGRKKKRKDEHCEWTGKLKDAEAHNSQCEFTLMNCPHDGCNNNCLRKDLPSHVEDCTYRPVLCEWCQVLKSADSIDLHLQCCSNRPVPCPYNCVDVNGEILRFLPRELDQHIFLCPMELVNCAFADSGCKITLQRKDMLLHEQDAGAHMLCCLKALQTAQKKITDLEQKMAAQEEIIRRLDNPDSSRIMLRVPISTLHKRHTRDVSISGYDFEIEFSPGFGTNDTDYHRLGVSLLGDIHVNLSRVVKVDACIVFKSGLTTKKESFTYKYISPGGRCFYKFIKTKELQNFPNVVNGHVSIRVDITLQ